MAQHRVFDTSALIALLEDEPEADEVSGLIERTYRAHGERLIAVVNLGEVWYQAARKRLDGDRGVQSLLHLGFSVVDADWELTRNAATLKLKYKLAFADSYAAALAQIRQCELVTLDTDFEKLKREVKVRLIRRK